MQATQLYRRSLLRIAQVRPVVKICGNRFFADSLMVASHDPDLMGWIFSPHSRRRVSVESARRQIESIRRIKPEIFHVAVFAGNTVPSVLHVVESISDFDFVQTADGPGMASELRVLLRRYMEVIPVVRVSGRIDDPGLSAWLPADWCVLDTAVPGTYGGTGQAMDLSFVSHVTRRHLLAGGLTPDNVIERIKGSNASGVDVSSGVELPGAEPGRKDSERVREFIARAKSVQFSR